MLCLTTEVSGGIDRRKYSLCFFLLGCVRSHVDHYERPNFTLDKTHFSFKAVFLGQAKVCETARWVRIINGKGSPIWMAEKRLSLCFAGAFRSSQRKVRKVVVASSVIA